MKKGAILLLLILFVCLPLKADAFQNNAGFPTKNEIFEPLWLFGLTIFFFLITLFMVFLYKRAIERKWDVEDKVKDQKKRIEILESSQTALMSKNRKLYNQLQNKQEKTQQTKKVINDPIPEEKSKPIDLPIYKPVKEVSDHFYAGKPTEDKIFTDLRKEPDPTGTVFKLTYLSDNREKAEFEVLIVDDFMTKNITNMPDDYLYRVCHHENSNHDFHREIITTKKGVAERVNGEWMVREINKATIKFQ